MKTETKKNDKKATYMLLILPSDYKKFFLEKYEEKIATLKKSISNSKMILNPSSIIKVAEIRKSSGRVGEIRFRPLEDIGSITLIDQFTPQKRWYKCMITYNDLGIKKGRPTIEFFYFFINPWILQKLINVAKKNKE